MKSFKNKAQRSPDYTELLGPNGTEDNLGGIITRLYYCPVSDLDTIQEPDESLSTFVNQADLATISSAHVPASGKGFIEMYNTQNSGSIKYSPQGERDGFSIKVVLEFFYPGSEPEFYGFIRKAKNDRFIWLATQPNGTTIHQIGSNLFPAYLKIKDGGTATNEGGRNGFVFEVESMGSGPMLYTAGSIPMHP
jgi:hypothetical protein